VALYLALTNPQLPKGVISMENSPVRGKLSPTFKKYIDAMKAITDAKLMKRTDAENILAKYEEVLLSSSRDSQNLFNRTKAFVNSS